MYSSSSRLKLRKSDTVPTFHPFFSRFLIFSFFIAITPTNSRKVGSGNGKDGDLQLMTGPRSSHNSKQWAHKTELAALSFFHELHTLDSLQVCVLCPDNCMVNPGGGYDHSIGKRQLYFMSDLRGSYSGSAIKIDHLPLLHQSG
jgi:hypothetical protein